VSAAVTRLKTRAGVAALVIAGVAAFAAGRSRPDRALHAPADPRLVLDATTALPPTVRDVLHRACFDCHSAATRWPWYSRLPPGSWIVTYDVNAGRRQLDFSAWGDYNPFDRADLLDKMCDQTTKARMPLWPYRLLHREARLSDADVRALCRWTDAEATRLVQGGP
jgi:hypothetical protein